jgi:large subunit ribosomal protein L19e
MTLSNQKRLAADIMNVGQTRIWVDPTRLDDVEDVITRDEIRKLISDGVIKARAPQGVSRGRARIRGVKRKKGLRRGPGSRRGKMTARNPKKKAWIRRIRAIRKHLRELVNRRIIQVTTYRRLYVLAKGGTFADIGEVNQYIDSHRLTRRR